MQRCPRDFILEVAEGRGSGALTGLGAPPETRGTSWGVGVSLWPEHQVRVPVEWSMSGHRPQLPWSALICGTVVLLRLLLGSDGTECEKVLCKLNTLSQGCVICVLENPGLPQKSLSKMRKIYCTGFLAAHHQFNQRS